MRKICAVIPAAGRGSRLGASIPKIFNKLTSELAIYDIIIGKLKKLAQTGVLILSPAGKEYYQTIPAFEKDAQWLDTAIQEQPAGMGDAVFVSSPYWKDATDILVVWGDQASVDENTLSLAAAAHQKETGRHITVPLVSQQEPYVEYVFENGRLMLIKEKREGDSCMPGGLSDAGIFLLSVEGLVDAWSEYLSMPRKGKNTGEINFLPFLAWLSREKDWPVKKILIADKLQSRGVNTKDDLEFFSNIYSGK